MPDTYSVSTWELEDGWELFRSGLSKWEIRPVLRELYSWGYTQISMQVKAETHDREAARHSRDWMPSTELPKSVRRRLAEQFGSTPQAG